MSQQYDSNKTLLVEDDDSARRIIVKTLEKRGHTVSAYPNAEAAWEEYQESMYPLVIIDWMLPGMSGIDFCEKIRSREKSRYTSILMITAKDTYENQAQALEAGADDYLIKPFSIHVLNLRIGVAENNLKIRIAHCLADDNRRQAQADLKDRMLQDSLTCAHNRRHIITLANSEMGRCKRYNLDMAVMLVDINGLQGINNEHGLVVGDETLKLTALALRNSIPDPDLFGRTGSSEFLAILPGVQQSLLEDKIEHYRLLLNSLNPVVGGQKTDMSCSIGAVFMARTDENFDMIFQRASQALTAAKAGDGKCVILDT